MGGSNHGQYQAVELQAERHLRQCADTAADSDQRDAGPCDDGVTCRADAGRNRDANERIGGLPLLVRQNTDR